MLYQYNLGPSISIKYLTGTLILKAISTDYSLRGKHSKVTEGAFTTKPYIPARSCSVQPDLIHQLKFFRTQSPEARNIVYINIMTGRCMTFHNMMTGGRKEGFACKRPLIYSAQPPPVSSTCYAGNGKYGAIHPTTFV